MFSGSNCSFWVIDFWLKLIEYGKYISIVRYLLYIIKQDIRKYVTNSWPNSRTECTKFFCGHSWVAGGCFRLEKSKIYFSTFIIKNFFPTGKASPSVSILYIYKFSEKLFVKKKRMLSPNLHNIGIRSSYVHIIGWNLGKIIFCRLIKDSGGMGCLENSKWIKNWITIFYVISSDISLIPNSCSYALSLHIGDNESFKQRKYQKSYH